MGGALQPATFSSTSAAGLGRGCETTTEEEEGEEEGGENARVTPQAEVRSLKTRLRLCVNQH
jgi:hypothetical protein